MNNAPQSLAWAGWGKTCEFIGTTFAMLSGPRKRLCGCCVGKRHPAAPVAPRRQRTRAVAADAAPRAKLGAGTKSHERGARLPSSTSPAGPAQAHWLVQVRSATCARQLSAMPHRGSMTTTTAVHATLGRALPGLSTDSTVGVHGLLGGGQCFSQAASKLLQRAPCEAPASPTAHSFP